MDIDKLKGSQRWAELDLSLIQWWRQPNSVEVSISCLLKSNMRKEGEAQNETTRTPTEENRGGRPRMEETQKVCI